MDDRRSPSDPLFIGSQPRYESRRALLSSEDSVGKVHFFLLFFLVTDPSQGSGDDDDNDDDEDDDILLASLRCDELLAWVDGHDIELQGSGRRTKKQGMSPCIIPFHFPSNLITLQNSSILSLKPRSRNSPPRSTSRTSYKG